MTLTIFLIKSLFGNVIYNKLTVNKKIEYLELKKKFSLYNAKLLQIESDLYTLRSYINVDRTHDEQIDIRKIEKFMSNSYDTHKLYNEYTNLCKQLELATLSYREYQQYCISQLKIDYDRF